MSLVLSVDNGLMDGPAIAGPLRVCVAKSDAICEILTLLPSTSGVHRATDKRPCLMVWFFGSM